MSHDKTQQDENSSVRKRSLRSFFQVIIVLLLMGIACFQVVRWYALVVQPTDLDYAESWHAYCAQQAYPGGDHVGNVEEPPFNILPYGPLSYLFNGGISGFSKELLTVRFMGRLGAAMMTLLSAVMVAAISSKFGRSLWYGILAALFFLSAQDVHMFAVSLRPDAMACVLALIATYCCLGRRSTIVSGILFSLSIAAKHSYIIGPFVMLLYFVRQRRYGAVIRFSAVISLTLLIIGVAAHFMLGKYWWQGLTLQGLQHANIKQALWFFRSVFRDGAGLPLLIGVVSLMLSIQSAELRALRLYFVLSLLANAVASAKIGAAHNYYLEPFALGSVLLGVGMKNFFSSKFWELHLPVYAAVVVVLLVTGIEAGVSASKLTKQSYNKHEDVTGVYRLLEKVSGPVLTTSSEIYFRSGHEPWASPSDFLHLATISGAVDTKGFMSAIKNKHFDVVVVQGNWRQRPFFPIESLKLIEESYHNYGLVGGYQIFVSPSAMQASRTLQK